jgi:hypothetical protein
MDDNGSFTFYLYNTTIISIIGFKFYAVFGPSISAVKSELFYNKIQWFLLRFYPSDEVRVA